MQINDFFFNLSENFNFREEISWIKRNYAFAYLGQMPLDAIKASKKSQLKFY